MSTKQPNHPPMSPVTSANIDAIGFDNRGLFIRFKGGAMYVYPDAPKKVHDEMLVAESVGRYFQQGVRGVYNHRQLDA